MSVADDSKPITLRQQVADLPPYILAAWRSRFVPVDGVDLKARAVLNKEAAAIRADGNPPEVLTVWIRLCDTVVRVGSSSPELLAAAALAGLAPGIRTAGFHEPDTAQPATAEGN